MYVWEDPERPSLTWNERNLSKLLSAVRATNANAPETRDDLTPGWSRRSLRRFHLRGDFRFGLARRRAHALSHRLHVDLDLENLAGERAA